MKPGIVIYSNDAEVVWNAFRPGVFALDENDSVRVFLLAMGVEVEGLDSEKFKGTEQMSLFKDKGGEMLACGTCLKIRHAKESELCPASTMADLYSIVSEPDRVMTS